MRSLGAGKHVAAFALDQLVTKLPYLPYLADEGCCAMLVRIRYADGRVARFNDLEARAAAAPQEGRAAGSFDDREWTRARRAETTEMPFASSGGALLRHEFDTSGRIVSARLYVTSLGAHETWLNGKRVDDGFLAPESTNFSKRILYRAHDVAALLRQGGNVIGAMVGDGWFGSRILSSGRFGFGERPLRYLAQLEIRYADGRMQTVTSGDRWFAGPSPITFTDIYDGEDYDARREQRGWATPGFFQGSDWAAAPIVAATKAVLESQVSPPIRKAGTLKPRSIKNRDGVHVVDFGQNFAGLVRINVKGRPGDRVTLKFAEVLKPNGDIDQANLRSARCADHYVLKGDAGGEVFEPHFTYHGFRYVEITAPAGSWQERDVEGVVLHTDLEETGQLLIDNPIIMGMWRNNLWSQRSNFMGIPTDCPQRDERMGWLGDANVFWDAAPFNMDVAAFTRRWMGDLRNSQTAEGVIPEISPTTWGVEGRKGATPGWADAGVILPWTVWQRYGDTSIIEQNWA